MVTIPIIIPVMGTFVQADHGCLCPENTLLNGVIQCINIRDGESILPGMQAGVGHFGRALVHGFNQVVLVADPVFIAVLVVKEVSPACERS
jgi:CO dehydrogenase nickel-insertion accessory protein CooC1